jgi:preprotein translocase subunit SecG
MQPLVLTIHVVIALCLVVLVLMQHGKGADVGAAFGSGASNTMFGSIGTTPFLMKITVILTAVFFITSIGLSYMAAREQRLQSTTAIPTVFPSTQQPMNTPPPSQPSE